VELTNFDKYGMVISDSQAASQNKDAKDLSEMRMIEVFTQCLETLGRFFSGRSSMGQRSQLILAVTLERLDSLSSFL
jgi:hypothetical protein